LKPLAREHAIPWARFEWEAAGVRTVSWHFFFVPASLVLLSFTGFAVAKWRGALASVLLLACGGEDLLYYALLRERVPAELPWLDPVPTMAWTRFVLGTEHVTCSGIVLSAAIAVGIAIALLWSMPREKT
jgi:hypothetical protein